MANATMKRNMFDGADPGAVQAQEVGVNAPAGGIIAGAQTPPATTVAPPPSGIIAQAQMPTVAPTASTPAAAPHDYSTDLSHLYQSDLSRTPDAAGMAYWQDRMNQGTTAGQVDQEIKNSDEYKAAHPGTTTTPAAPATAAPSLLGTPTQWSVNKDQTVAGQMQNLIDPNSPYYQQWAHAGAADAAARGFTGNSSIRDTAILDSVMRGATPIATSDAGTHAKAAGYNADMSNQFSVANQNSSNQLAVANLSAGTQRYVADQSAATQKAVQQMSTQSQQTISQAHDANTLLIQNNQAAAQAYTNYVSAVASIDQQPGMDEAAKRSAIVTQTQIFNNAIAGLRTNSSGTPDVSSPLDINATPNAAAQAVGGVDVSSLLQF
jgi:hypothetical protein